MIALHENALRDPRVRAFLDMISVAEGTTKHGYHTLVGGSRIASLNAHPGKVVKLSSTLSSSAAGRYQFLSRTWRDLAQKLGLRDFSERSQDLAAVELLRQCGALPLVQAGNVPGAIKAARRIWASFPGAGYGQGERSLSYLQSAYNKALLNGGNAALVVTKATIAAATTIKDNPLASFGIGTAGAFAFGIIIYGLIKR